MALKDSADEGADEAATPPLPRDVESPLSPESQTTSTTMASPVPSSSPFAFVTLAEQTFTPLSMDDATDFYPPDTGGALGKKSPAVQEDERLLTTARSMEQLRRDGNLSRSSSISTAGRIAPAVSAVVESFEALHAAAATANLGYELLRTRSQGQRPAGLVSPPSTLSPDPSISRSPSPSPAGKAEETVPDAQPSSAGTGLGAAAHKTPVAVRDENISVPQTAAAPPPNPDPSAPLQSHDAANPPAAATVSSSAADSPPSTVVADTALIRPTPAASQSPQRRSRAVSNPTRPPIVRTSSSASLSLSHPMPDPNKLSQAGGFLGNIAALEATAERLSMTSSIEEAIREEHNELKRTESRRSSVLRSRARAASAASAISDTGSVFGQSQLSVASRQNSILGINNAARSGGYSPGGFVMSPHHSMSAASGRLRSGSKASSIGMPSHIPEQAAPDDAEHAQEFRFLPRHGPGKASTRSVASKLSLAQIAELEHPTALTQEALDEADRSADQADDEDNIRASAHQFIEAEFANELDAVQPGDYSGTQGEQAPRLQLHQPDDEYQHYGVPHNGEDERPTTSGSHTTFEQAQAAFGDFDGVHCDPEADNLESYPQPEVEDITPRPPPQLGPRPTSYFDPATGQQMLFYPAPVPAMLNLPPKLSRKPKPAAKPTHRSQVVSALPKPPRESWLPDPIEGLRTSHDDAPFMSEYLGGEEASTPAGMEAETPHEPSHARHESQATIRLTEPLPEQQPQEMRRPQRLAEAEARKSRPINIDGMPPQLRASAFFDLPPQVPTIEAKDGSAMDTLDSLLDASAAAPVSAFTDHVFAGKLGSEVYGTGAGKKKKGVKKSATAPALAVEDKAAKRKTLVKRNSSGNLLDPETGERKPRKLVKRNSASNLLDPESEKKRASRFSLFGAKPPADDSDDDHDVHPHFKERNRRRRAASDGTASPNNQLAPDADEEIYDDDDAAEEEDDDEEEEEQAYHGPPTTLLAELQLRKQQNKLRTRPLHYTHPDGALGMRSTLLELDAVAEVERRARHGKRVTLAWEDPAAVPRSEEEDDEDVPLGMLYAAKAAAAGNGLGGLPGSRSTMDISALMGEVHRPLGLMERREMEENEPLSRRRDRLQGRAPEAGVPATLSALQKRVSQMPGGGGGGLAGLRSQSRLALPLPAHGGGRGSRPGSSAGEDGKADGTSDPEIEGETLAARKARLAAENPLPRARPVSGAFSSELLSVFGPDDEDAKSKSNAATAHSRNVSGISFGGRSGSGDKENDPTDDADADAAVPEEQETLGQRRRRLQREREAREREMAFSSLTRAATPLGLNPNPPSSHLGQGLSAVNRRPATATTPGVGVAHVGPGGMADVLASHYRPGLVPTADPREQERLRREAEAARHRREAELKMAAMRAQMPASLTAPDVGARSGGFMGGRFNDGWGGGGVATHGYQHQQAGMVGMAVPPQQRASTMLGAGMGLGQGMYGGSTPNLGAYGAGVGVGVNGVPMQGYHQHAGAMAAVPMQAASAMHLPMQMQMQMGAGGQGHIDMVERWRQGVMP